MPAQTRDEWEQKLRGWVPAWWFSDERYAAAVAKAMAEVFSAIDAEIEHHVEQTFIAQSSNPVLGEHGWERSVDQLFEESDLQYSTRIRSLSGQHDVVNMKKLVDSLLKFGSCSILSGFIDAPYLDRGSFLGRDRFMTDYHYNFFTIAVDKQNKEPLAHYSRGYFASRGDYVGEAGALNPVYQSIVAAVDRAKALGVLYRIVER